MHWESFGSYRGVFVEITKDDHGHGGAGWEFGSCLWSPRRNKAGADRYSIMRAPATGDLVLHFLARTWPDGTHESRLAGRSQVKTPVRETDREPPRAGDWAGSGRYYRIELQSFEDFTFPLPLRRLVEEYGDEIRGDILNSAPRFYPFNRWGDSVRTVQGIYLAQATPGLYGVIHRALGLEVAGGGTIAAEEGHAEYVESRRLARERYYFARNPGLVKAAKHLHGYRCQVCDFDFEQRYGDVGWHYIECHHLNPLSERPEEEQLDGATTDLSEVAVVCANCHRMLHRRRPALGVDELKQLMNVPPRV